MLGGDDVVADGVVDEFGYGMETQFEHDVGAMGFGSIHADVEERSDFLVRFAFGEELKDFSFAGSKAGARGLGGRVRRIALGKRIGQASGEERLVPACGVNGVEQSLVSFVLEDVAAGAGFDGLQEQVGGLVHSEDEDFGGGRGGANAADGPYAVEERHGDIEDDDVRFECQGFFDGVAAIGGFGDDSPTAVRFEKST